METMKTDVMYRKDKEGVVFALFPGHAGTNSLDTCSSFELVGGHSSADLKGCITTSKPAKPDEYKRIHEVLTNCYGYDLNIVKRANNQHEVARAVQVLTVPKPFAKRHG